MKKTYLMPFNSFSPALFQNAETIICKEMSEAWLNRDHSKQVQLKEGGKLILKKGESVAISRGYENGIHIFAVFTVEK